MLIVVTEEEAKFLADLAEDYERPLLAGQIRQQIRTNQAEELNPS